MIREYLPSEDSQLQVYSKIFKEVKGEEVSIRVLDIGADKPLTYLKMLREDNPVLGWRGIRTPCEKHPPLRELQGRHDA